MLQGTSHTTRKLSWLDAAESTAAGPRSAASCFGCMLLQALLAKSKAKVLVLARRRVKGISALSGYSGSGDSRDARNLGMPTNCGKANPTIF